MKLTIDSLNRISLPQFAARELGGLALELVSHSDRHLLLAAGKNEGPVVLTGVLGEISVADLLSFFNMFRKTGILRFQLQGGSKELFLKQGEIVNATSTFPEEDLGELLCAQGALEREALGRIRQAASPLPLGQLLLDRQLVTPQALWAATRQQVEGIVHDLFAFRQGSFSFLARELRPEEVVVPSLSTQNLLMEGLRRLDERQLFMRRLRSLDALAFPTGKKDLPLAADEEQALQLLEDAGTEIRAFLRRSGAEEFAALRLLYQLLEKGAIRIENAPPAELSGPLGEIVGIFNAALSALFRRVTARNSGFAQEIRCFLRDLPAPYFQVFQDVALREDGTLDGRRIAANLQGLAEADQKKLLVASLTELIFMETIAARRDLGTAESAELIQRVQEVSRRAKEIAGRNG